MGNSLHLMEKHEDRLNEIMDSHWMLLWDTIQRTHSFVAIFAGMVRREFYHSPFVLNCWRDKNFPLLAHAIQHVHLLAYGCTELTADEIAISDAGRILVIDPLLHGEKRKHDPKRIATQKFAGYARMLIDRIRLIFDSKMHPPTARVLLSIAVQMREVQLCVDELCLALKAWGDTLHEVLDVSNSKPTVYAPRLVYSERSRIRYADILQHSTSTITRNADLLSLCMETRTATLAGFYEVALGFDCLNKNLNIFESLRKIHEEALKRFSTLRQQGDGELLHLAKQSMEWRLSELIPEAEMISRTHPRQVVDDGVECECYFQIRPDWGKAESSVSFQVIAKAKEVKTFLKQVENEILSKAGWEVSQNQIDNPPEVLLVPIPLGSISKPISERITWDAAKLQVSIQLNSSEVDEHLLRAIRFAYLRLLSRTETEPLSFEFVWKQFDDDLLNRRMIGLMEYANTTVRIRSTLELDRGRNNMLTCIESANGVSGRPMRLEPIPISKNRVNVVEAQEQIVNLFHRDHEIRLESIDPASIVFVMGSAEIYSGLDFSALPDGFRGQPLWEASERITRHGFTDRSFRAAIERLGLALDRDIDAP